MKKTLDLTRMEVQYSDGYWRYVDHFRGLLTIGFVHRGALDAMAPHGFLATQECLGFMRKRYTNKYGKKVI